MQRYRPEYITTVCIDVRMSMEGVSDTYSDGQYLDVYHWLLWRWQHWVDYRPFDTEFDQCVKKMVRLTLDEMEELPCVRNYYQDNERLAKLSVGT